MATNIENPAHGCVAGLGNLSCSAADNPEISPNTPSAQARNPRAVREAKLELVRDLLRESLGFALLYASVAQQLNEVRDDFGTLIALRNFRAAANAACEAGRQIRDSREGGAV
jgi:hypothetical protein